MTGKIDIEEVQLPREGTPSRDFIRDVMGLLDFGFDGRPDMWKPIGGDFDTPEIMIVAKVELKPVGLAWGQKQVREIPDTSDHRDIDKLELLTANTWFLKHISVLPNSRRIGVGARLVDAAEAVAARTSATGVSVIFPLPEVPNPGPNPPVRGYATDHPLRRDTAAFFERRGYSDRGRVSHLYSLGIPVTNQLMIKEFA